MKARTHSEPVNLRKYLWLVGIDPGTKTGLALYNMQRKALILVETVSIVQALDYLTRFEQKPALFVRIEDARKRKWFGNADERMERSGAGIREGIGSVKRDCSIWEEFLRHHKIAFELVHPAKNKTKLDAQTFSHYTHWPYETSEHSRDAAMLVWGY